MNTVKVNPVSVHDNLMERLDAAVLTPVVSQALGVDVTVTGWESEPLGVVDFSVKVASGGIYRLAGTALDEEQRVRDWALVVKLLKSPAGIIMPDGSRISREMADDQVGFGYWRRELLAARSDLFEALPPGLTTPEYYQPTEMGEVTLLWQSDVAGGKPWRRSHYREAAFRLGRWAGSYASGRRPIPEHGWLSRNWLRDWVQGPLERIMDAINLMGGWNHPLLQAYLAPEELIQLKVLWARRGEMQHILDGLPLTISHLDAYPSNLIWQGDNLTMIDWAFVGTAAVGEEMAGFVGATLLLDHLPVEEAAKLEDLAFDGYLAGLRKAGWRGDAEQVWLAYRIVMPLRYAFLALANMLRTELEPGYADYWQRSEGRPLAELLQQRASFIRFLLSRVG